MRTENKSNRLQIIDTIIKAFATILIPILIFLASISYNKSQERRIASQEYVRLAIGMLRDKPTEENKPLKKWATDLLEKYAPQDVKPDSAVLKALREQSIGVSPCPPGTVPDSFGGCVYRGFTDTK